MFGSIFLTTLKDNLRGTIYWGLGFGLLAAFMMFILPDVDTLSKLQDGMESFSPVILAMLGVGTAEEARFMGTMEGFIALGFFGKMLLFFVVYPLVMGFRVTTHEEDEGLLDMVLSLPVPRWRVILERFLGYVLLNTVVVALIGLGFWVGQQMTGVEVDMVPVMNSVINLIPTMTFVLAVTVFIGALISRKKYVLIIGVGFILYSYAFDVLGLMGTGSFLENIRAISFIKYFDSSGVMQNGLSMTSWAGFIALSLMFLGASLWAFNRRDIGA